MKATVDPDLCIGCSVCEQLCAVVFEMNGSLAVVKGDSVPADAEDLCEAAADSCPVDAIAITE